MARLRSREEQVFELSEAAVALSRHLSDVMEDTTQGDTALLVYGTSRDDPLTNARLQHVVQLLEATAAMQADGGAPAQPEDTELSERAIQMLLDFFAANVLAVAKLIGDLKWLDCPVPANLLALWLARLLRGKNAQGLRDALRLQADFMDEDDEEAGAIGVAPSSVLELKPPSAD